MRRAQAEYLLQEAVGSDQARFRPGQWEAIDLLVNHRSKLIVVERTGWGKSTVYFISTRILRDRGGGPTLIVSPLLALMRNQLEAAGRLGVRAETINSTNAAQWSQIRERTLGDEIDALLISPERLANESFVDSFLMPIATRLGLLVVDEVHCISDWGHDFRPDYRRLGNVLGLLPRNSPVLGTTATANDRVIADVEQVFGGVRVQRGPLARTSLVLQATRMPSQAERLAWLAKTVPTLPGTGIIYVLTTRDAEQVARWLHGQGIAAHAYFGSVEHKDFPDSNAYRQRLEDLLLNNRIKALVATTALGMGYDKPDLGFVIHYQAPSSVIAYYQQVGRAGRAIGTAICVLLAGSEDSEIVEYFRRTAFPDETEVKEVLGALESSEGMSIVDLGRTLNLRRPKIEKVLKIIGVERPAPVIKEGTKWLRTPVPYRMDRERIRRLTAQREAEWEEIQRFIDSDSCLMAYLRSALDDPGAADCGKCANCTGGPVVDATPDFGLTVKATHFLRRSEIRFEPKRQADTKAFPTLGLGRAIRPEEMASEGRILARWGDAGWGTLVAAHKENGHLGDELVEALAELIRERWRPAPNPRWVTCIPSLRNPNLVPSFAGRLAEELGLPFREAVAKVKDNEPQKFQENVFHQSRNLDGAFGIAGRVPNRPVLLVDDVIDSGWTMTVAAAMLRRAGSGAVFPVALASAAPR